MGILVLSSLLTACTGSNSPSTVDTALGLKTNTDPFGTNGNSALLISPLVLDFGTLRVQTSSSVQFVSISNVVSAPVYIASIGSSSSPHFSIVSSNCPTTPSFLDKGKSCTVGIVFNPQNVGTLNWSFGVIFGRSLGDTQYQAYSAVKGFAATTVNFAGISSIDQIRSTSMRLNWTDVVGENGFFVFLVNPSTGALQYFASAPTLTSSFTATGLTPNTSYTFRVQAVDFFGNIDSNTVNVTATTTLAPVLTSQQNMFMTTAAGEMVVGNTYNFDFNNVAYGSPGDDVNMNYSCYYDTLIDGTVAPVLPCSSLAGFAPNANFGTNGVFSWTPPVNTLSGKSFELLIQGSDGSTTASRTFGVTIRDPYIRTNLFYEISANFAYGGNSGAVSLLSNAWENLLAGGNSLLGTLTGTFTSKWQGNGTDVTNVNRLVFD